MDFIVYKNQPELKTLECDILNTGWLKKSGD